MNVRFGMHERLISVLDGMIIISEIISFCFFN